MAKLNFSNVEYKNTALNLQRSNSNNHSSTDAFLVLIRGVNIEDLSNLCEMMQQHYLSLPNPIELSLDDCYKLTQSNNLEETEKHTIVSLAEQCIKSGNHLGSKTINDGKINTSSWISHSFYSGEVCGALATQLGLDVDSAKTFGLLHDYGRKFIHTFDHVIKGFEALIDIGWYNESIGCLTHSFVNGGRCSNNEPAVEGFYVDDEGNAKWKIGTSKDDMTLFLENYNYTDYDILLTIADLMATDKGIVSPKDRIADIATRRQIDPTNRGYFLADITNTFIDILKKLNLIDNHIEHIKANKNTSLDEIQSYFNKVSEYFFNAFLNLSKIKKQNII